MKMTDLYICRACLRRTPEMVSLFNPYRNFTIAHFITSLTDIKITENQKNFPKHLCSACLEELEVVLNFKNKCKDTDKYLKSLSKLTVPCKSKLIVEPKTTPGPTDKHLKSLSQVWPSQPPAAPCDISEIKEESSDEIKEESSDEIKSENLDDIDALDSTSEFDNDYLADEHLIHSDNLNLKAIKEPTFEYYECHDCGERLRTKCKLRVHWKRTHNFFKCEKCKRIFKAFRAFKNHSQKGCVNPKIVKIVGEGKKRLFCCRHCDYETHSYTHLRIHSTHHTGERAYSCDICGKSYTQWGGLYDHKERIHKIYRMEITCDHCGKHVKGRAKCYTHLKTHQETKFQCDICKAFLKTRQIMAIHMKSHFSQRKKIPAACEICGKVLSCFGGLKKHKNLVHFITILSCKMCKFQHKDPVFIKKHERRHFQENMIQCSICYLFFDGQKLFDCHMNNKHGTKTHFCVFCKKGFKKRHTVLSHQNREHAEEVKNHSGLTYIRISPRERSKLKGVKAEEYINMMTKSV